MTVTIHPRPLCGTITPPPSKSQAHRLVIAAALADGESTLKNVALSQDIAATARCMRALGADISPDGTKICGVGGNRYACTPCCDTPVLDCGESGSTLRFLIPVALAVRQGGVFRGRGRLLQRPQQPYADLFAEKNIWFRQSAEAITAYGALTPGEYRLAGNVSSQFITGLLYALPLLDGDSEIVLTTALESRGYVDMTRSALAAFGVRAAFDGARFTVPGNQRYVPGARAVEADWSQAGFWYAAAGTGSAVTIAGMDPASAQGDRVIADWAAQLSGTGTVTLDVSDCPDLVPPLAAWAALRDGCETRLVNAARLRMKESDRLAAVREELCKLGADVTEGTDFLTIRGRARLTGGVVDSHNDHRIAMMLAVAATRADGPVTITGADSVRKSYPNFWDDYEALGGNIERSGT